MNLSQLTEDYHNWLKIGENMSKKPIAYFASEEARGQYSGWLKTKAWYEISIAQQMELEQEEGCFPVAVKKEVYY